MIVQFTKIKDFHAVCAICWRKVLALAIISDDSNREWVALQTHTDTAGFVESIDDFQLSVSNVDVLLNLDADDGSVVDFTKTDLTVKTGTATDASYEFTASGKSLAVSGNLDLNIANFITIEGGFSYEKSQKEMTLDSGVDVTVDVLSAIISEAFNAFFQNLKLSI